jgi:hypothetical protein
MAQDRKVTLSYSTDVIILLEVTWVKGAIFPCLPKSISAIPTNNLRKIYMRTAKRTMLVLTIIDFTSIGLVENTFHNITNSFLFFGDNEQLILSPCFTAFEVDIIDKGSGKNAVPHFPTITPCFVHRVITLHFSFSYSLQMFSIFRGK